MRHGLDRDDAIGAGCLALVVAPDFGAVAHREVGRLDVGPGQILVAVLGVTTTLELAVGEVLAAHAAAVGGVVVHLGETPDLTGLQHVG